MPSPQPSPRGEREFRKPLTFLNTHLAFLDCINRRTGVYVDPMRRTALVVSMIMAAAFQLCVSNGVRGFQQKVESVVGAVADIDKSSKRATIKTDAGEMITVKTDDNTVCLRIPAGEKTLSKAAPIQFADVTVESAQELYGSDGAKIVRDAWNQVGVIRAGH